MRRERPDHSKGPYIAPFLIAVRNNRFISLKEVGTLVDLPRTDNLRRIILGVIKPEFRDGIAKMFDNTMRLELHLFNHPKDDLAKDKHKTLKDRLISIASYLDIDKEIFVDKYDQYKRKLIAEVTKTYPTSRDNFWPKQK